MASAAHRKEFSIRAGGDPRRGPMAHQALRLTREWPSERGRPVRLFQQFATLDLIHRAGRDVAAGSCGRGPLFGLDLSNTTSSSRRTLRSCEVRDESPAVVGQFRCAHRKGCTAAIRSAPLWLGVGGTHSRSFARACWAFLMVAIIGRRDTPLRPRRFYREAGRRGFLAGPAEGRNALARSSPTVEGAAGFHPTRPVLTDIGKERGWATMTRPSRCQLSPRARAPGDQRKGGEDRRTRGRAA